MKAAESIIHRIAGLDLGHIGTITVSAGIALAPQHTRERDELVRLVDGALYWAKEYGKNRAHVHRPEDVELAELKALAAASTYEAAPQLEHAAAV